MAADVQAVSNELRILSQACARYVILVMHTGAARQYIAGSQRMAHPEAQMTYRSSQHSSHGCQISLIDWISDTLHQGYTNLQSLVQRLDHRGIASDTVCKIVLGCAMH